MIIDFGTTGLEEQIKQAVIEELGDDFATVSGTVASAAYISSSTTIDFYNGDGQVISQIDASKFVTDGMVDNVYISGNTLYIVFNTDAGKQTIEVELPSVFDPDNYYTKAETDAAITAATQNLATEAYVDAAVTAATEDMATEAYVDAAITAATEDLATESYVDNAITAATEGLASESYVDNAITAATADFVTSGDVEAQITAATQNYVTSGDVKTQIEAYNYLTSADTQDFVTSGDVKSQIEGYNYVTSGDVKTQVEAYGYLTSADTENFVTSGDVKSQIEGYNYITSGDAQSQIEAATADFVTSGDVETQITSKGYATEAYVTGATSGLQETLVSGTNIKTVGGNSLLGSGNIPWPAVDTVLATGSTNAIENGTVAKALELKANKSDIPTKVSDLQNDEGYLTSADTQDFVTSGDVKSQIEDYHYITSGDAKSQIESYNYAPLEVSTPYSAVSTSAEYFFGLTPLDKSDYIDGTAMSIAQDGKIFYHQTVTAGYLPCIYYTDDVEVAGFMGLVTGGSTPLVYGEPYELELAVGAVGLDDAYNNELLPSDFWAVVDGSSITFYNAVPEAVKTVVYSDQLTPGDWATEEYVDNAITAATQNLVTSGQVQSQITAATQSLEITGMDIHNSATIAPTYIVLSGTTTYADGNTKNFSNMGALDAVKFAQSGPMSSYDYVTLEALRSRIDATNQIQMTGTAAPFELLDANGNVIGNFNTCESYGNNPQKTIPNLYGFQLSSSYVPSGTSVTFCIHDTAGYYLGGANINMGKRSYSQVIKEGTLTRNSSYNGFTLREDDTRILYLWLETSKYNPTLYVGWQPRPYFGYADASALVTTADTQNFLTSGDIKTVQSKSLIGTGNQDLFVSLTQAEYDALVQAGTVDTAITYYITDAPAPVTSGEVQAQITAATQNFVTSGQVQSQITAATQNFVTSGDVQAQITAATQNFVTSGDVQTVVDDAVSAATVDFVTSGDVQTVVDDAVSAATADFVTSGDVQTVVDAAVSAATADYVTSGEVESQITSKGYTTSGDVDSQIIANTADCVRYYGTIGPYIIRTLSQAEYDQIAEPDETTLYIIKN